MGAGSAPGRRTGWARSPVVKLLGGESPLQPQPRAPSRLVLVDVFWGCQLLWPESADVTHREGSEGRGELCRVRGWHRLAGGEPRAKINGFVPRSGATRRGGRLSPAGTGLGEQPSAGAKSWPD